MRNLLFILFLLPSLLLAQEQTPSNLTDLSKYHDDGRLLEKTDDNLAIITDTTDVLRTDANTNAAAILTKQSANYTAINAETGTSYTFVLADDDEYTTFTNGAAITVEIPLNSSVAFPIGATIDCEQAGAGAVTFDVATGVTANYFGSDSVSAGQYAVFTLIKRGTDLWTVVGKF